MALELGICLGGLISGPGIDRDGPRCVSIIVGLLGGRCNGAVFAGGGRGTGCLDVGCASMSVIMLDNIGSMGSTLAISTADPDSIWSICLHTRLLRHD